MRAAQLSRFYAQLHEQYLLECCEGVLDWDQQVYLPAGAGAFRAAQLELLSRLIHDRVTAPAFVTLVNELVEQLPDLAFNDQVNVRETKKQIDRQSKLPADFVAEKARLAALAYTTWIKARPISDWAAVEPCLTRLIELARREAELVGYVEHPYDAHLDLFEPGCRVAVVKPLLLNLAEALRELLNNLGSEFSAAPAAIELPVDQQMRLCKIIAERLGYDFSRGRIDLTAHPFEATLGPCDARITTRLFENDFCSGLFSVIHETGHALYELGLPEEYRGTPRGSAVSMGLHESQSRLWENFVGRSQAFCTFLRAVMVEQAQRAPFADERQLWLAINPVRPSLLRVEADEVTYGLHIAIRLILEEALLEGTLQVSELPAAWDELYLKYLGVSSPDLKDGVLQDVHWFSGLFGYFPSYALGNLTAAMLVKTMEQQIGSTAALVAGGHFKPILGWLRQKVHTHGKSYTSAELIQLISGGPLTTAPFLDYLKNKFCSTK